MKQLKFSKRTVPQIPADHPEFKWSSGADVQSTWHRYTGWTPPSGNWLKPEPIVVEKQHNAVFVPVK